MPLSPRDEFKVAFLARCVEDRLTPAEMLDRVGRARTKLASLTGMLGGLAGKGMDVARGTVGGLAGYGIPLALAAPPIAGGLAGYGLARATDLDDTDVDEIKDRELVEEYRRQTAQLLRQRAVRDYQKARQRTGRVFV